MLPRHTHTHGVVKFRVTVTDVVGVQRVLTLMTGRQHTLTRFTAEEAGAGRWTLALDVTAGPREAALVEARLHRVPAVLTVELDAGLSLAPAG